MKLEQHQPTLNIKVCCSLFGYSRQAFYQYKRHEEKEAFEEELVIQEVLIERKLQKRLGGRKLFFRLKSFMQHHSIGMGRDAFFTVLRNYGLLVKKRKRKMVTTDSKHWLRKYPNLIKDFIPIGPNQLWVSDITYIVIGNGFGYLSLITDAFSRKIVGFFLCKDLTAKGCIAALKMAYRNNPIVKGLIHHSDRGVQYCSNDYVKLLELHITKISMTENGDPLENAIAERVNGILKDELLEKKYSTFEIAQQAVAVSASTYNHFRPHGSISNYTPQEAHSISGLELKRLWKNYYKPKIKEVAIGTG